MSRLLMEIAAIEAVDAETDYVYGVRADGEEAGDIRIPAALLGGQSGARPVHDRGTVDGGTETPEPSDGELQVAVNDGAHELAAPSETGFYRLVYTNGETAGAVTPTGWGAVFDAMPPDGEEAGEGGSVLDHVEEGAVIELVAVNDGIAAVLQATLLVPAS